MSEWENVALGDFGSFTNGINKDKNAFGKGVPFVNLLDIYGKESISREPAGLVQVTENEIRNYDLKKGDILFARSSVKPEGVGQTCVVLRNFDRIVYSGFIIRYRQFDQKIWYQYAKYCFDNPIVRRSVLAKSTVSANTNINQESLKTITVPLPPLPHQRKIARILTTVDNIIEKTEAAIEKYKAIKQGMMHDLFTRGIDVKTGKLRPKFEDAPELYKESELGWIPKEWEVKRLDEIGSIISGGTPSSNIPDYWNGSIIWVTPADLSKLKFGYIADSERKITSFGLKNSSALLIPQRSIVLSSRAPIGYCAIVEKDFTTNQGCKSLALFEGNSAEFYYYNIVNHVNRIKIKGEGTTFAEISKKALEKIPFVWSKPKEQAEIAKRLRSNDKHTQIEEYYLNKYQKLKSGLMQDLLTGKKEVTPDPEDYKDSEN